MLELFCAIGFAICAILHCLILNHAMKNIRNLQQKTNFLENKWSEHYQCIVILQEDVETLKKRFDLLFRKPTDFPPKPTDLVEK